MGMTIAEKILARKSNRKKVAPGDLVTVEVDTVVMIDNSFIASRWRNIQKVRDPARIVVVFDHRVPASTEDAAAAHRTGRQFVEKFGIKRFHDVGYDQGISHQLVADHGYALPGTILVCSDSHTCSGGVFNCIARGVGEPPVGAGYGAVLNAIADAVGGKRVETFALAKGYQDPHFVEPKPSFILKLSRADLLIVAGLELEIGAP